MLNTFTNSLKGSKMDHSIKSVKRNVISFHFISKTMLATKRRKYIHILVLRENHLQIILVPKVTLQQKELKIHKTLKKDLWNGKGNGGIEGCNTKWKSRFPASLGPTNSFTLWRASDTELWRLSIIVTLKPFCRSCSTVCVPMNPAPPVTSIFSSEDAIVKRKHTAWERPLPLLNPKGEKTR